MQLHECSQCSFSSSPQTAKPLCRIFPVICPSHACSKTSRRTSAVAVPYNPIAGHLRRFKTRTGGRSFKQVPAPGPAANGRTLRASERTWERWCGAVCSTAHHPAAAADCLLTLEMEISVVGSRAAQSVTWRRFKSVGVRKMAGPDQSDPTTTTTTTVSAWNNNNSRVRARLTRPNGGDDRVRHKSFLNTPMRTRSLDNSCSVAAAVAGATRIWRRD